MAVLPAPQTSFTSTLSGQTKPRIYPLGGDVRYLISADGNKIVERRQMHKSIIEPPALDKARNSPRISYPRSEHLPEDTDVFHVLTQDPRVPEWSVRPLPVQGADDGSIAIEKTRK